MELVDLALSLFLPFLIVEHLIIAPYTKVEESFNIQAAHDVLVYDTPTFNVYERLTGNFDHFSFPGAVPRTFIGPVLLAGLSRPVVDIVGFDNAQSVVRAFLGIFNAGCLLLFRHNVARAFGTSAARWYLLLQASQFHVIFYASRTLPNTFAFGLTTCAFSFLLPHPNPKMAGPRQRLAIALFVFAGVIFRSEVALLLATSALYLLIIPQTSLERLIPPFVVAFTVSLLLSVSIDSYFWQKPLWPELWGFYYNVVLGSSSDWGVSPWHYYFTSALPRLLLNPLVPLLLIPTALRQPATARAARQLVIPSMLFVAIYSLQPHKEARFIIYVVPPLTAAAALGANYLFVRRTKSLASALLVLVLLASVLASLLASTGMLLLSSLNYPGGDALAHVRALVADAGTAADSAVVPVHADVLACMTGVTLFGTATGSAVPGPRAVAGPGTANLVGSNIASASSGGSGGGGEETLPVLALDKTEDDAVLLQEDFWRRFDYLLMEDPSKVVGGRWETVAVVQGYGGLELLRPGQDGAGEEETNGTVVLGSGAAVRSLKERVRALTGGWWVGPKMVPKLHVLKRVKEAERLKKATVSAS